ncbi:MAG TPA: hypothetical protein ENJ53_10825 [Phaeodactylibacter sp.]|nr:hypothetical protein [Phaeodactylibacter sp.]
MAWHQDIENQQIHQHFLSKINLQELDTLNGNYSAFDSGDEFINPDHPYTVDLDIFGKHSFYQFSNRTSTAIGQIRLAEYLKQGVVLSEILARQKAIAELKNKIDWRQNLQAYGMVAKDNIHHVAALKKWLNDPTIVYHKKWLVLSLMIGPPLFLAFFIFVAVSFPWQYLGFTLILPLLVIRKTIMAVNETHRQTFQAEKLLAYYANLIKHAEEENFKSEKLKNLHAAFISNNLQASKQLRKLSYLIGQLNTRQNIFAIFLNLFTLWDLQWVYQLEKWKMTARETLPKWFEALAELEALSSLSTVFYNNPNWIFPNIHNEDLLDAKVLGHPLIPLNTRITNDISIPTKGHIKLLTGSNMAGKSTLLRTVGLNIVLAMIGSPVCAEHFSLPQLKVYTSMRTQDALHENTSSFYAELKRLKFIIDAVENGDNIFFLLDEILKGTNSKDRHSGSKALIEQLIHHKGSGIVATHDLELGSMAASANGAIENICMEVEVENGQLVFDYKIKKGVSQSFNATHLMRQMGIRV